MFTLIAQNKYGQQIELTDNEAYTITSIVGLDPPDATINTSRNANADGSVFNSSYINDRQIIITMAINYPAEENRINLYTYFKTKMPITLYFANETRDVYINGYVQDFSCDFFAKKQVAQITIDCPKPFFMSVEDENITLSQVVNMFEFPFAIELGKNLLEVTATSRTNNGITYTVNEDGSITVNGTATANSNIILGAVGLKGGTAYALNGCPTGGGGSTYRLYWQGVSGNYDEGSGATYTPSSDGAINIRIAIYKGATVNNLTFYPMVRLASIGDSSFVPYDDSGIEFSTIEENNIVVVNNGDVETGAEITIHALGAVSNPIIYNVETSEFFGVITEMVEGDDIIINTIQKEKEVIKISDGVTTNLIGSIKSGSTWLQIIPGTSEYTMTAEGQPENIYATFTLTDLYEGV
jgi:hypothetical protein